MANNYFPPSYFGESYFGATDSATGAIYAALSGTSALTAVISVAGGAIAGNMIAALAGGSSLSAVIGFAEAIIPPTVIYDAAAWASIPIALFIPTPIGAALSGASRLKAKATAGANLPAKLGGASTVGGNANAIAGLGVAIGGKSALTASLTGVFDYITDDNNFWLLAD